MNTLVIGGSGHVSGAVVNAALKAGHTVWAVTRGQRPVAEGVKLLKADRHDHDAFAAVITGENRAWDLVIDCICYEVADIRQNLSLFGDRAKQFVLVSTDFVYDPALRRFPQPVEPACYIADGQGSASYGAKKRLCELALTETDTGSMDWTIVRPCHIYGPSSQLGCFPLHGRDRKLIDRLRADEPLKLVGGGRFLQQPILVDDLAAVILGVAGNDLARKRIFNTAGPDIIESRRYYEIIADALGVPVHVESVPEETFLAENPGKAPFICHRIYDLASLADAALPVPSTPIAEGLRQHVKGLLKQRQ